MTLLELEAQYLEVSPECLYSIQHKDNGGNRVLRFNEDYHAKKKNKKRKKAKRLRGNKYVKFYDFSY